MTNIKYYFYIINFQMIMKKYNVELQDLMIFYKNQITKLYL